MEECYISYRMFSQRLEGIELGYMGMDDRLTHITRILLPDAMHDLLEGILQYESKLVLNTAFWKNVIYHTECFHNA